MKAENTQFNNIVETIYKLPLEDRIELKSLLEHNIADSRREEIAANYKKAQAEQKEGKLKFSSSILTIKSIMRINQPNHK